MVLTMVVFPTPGPPVMMSTRCCNASRTARSWLSASFFPVFCSAQETPLGISIDG